MDFEKELKEINLIENSSEKIHQTIMCFSEHKNDLIEEEINNFEKFKNAFNIFLNVYIRLYEDFKKFEKETNKKYPSIERTIENQIKHTKTYFTLLQKKKLENITEFNEIYGILVDNNKYLKQEFNMLAQLKEIKNNQTKYSKAA